MKKTLTLAAFAMLLLPAQALAQGCADRMKETTASTCAEGSTFDTATGACLPVTTS